MFYVFWLPHQITRDSTEAHQKEPERKALSSHYIYRYEKNKALYKTVRKVDSAATRVKMPPQPP